MRTVEKKVKAIKKCEVLTAVTVVLMLVWAVVCFGLHHGEYGVIDLSISGSLACLLFNVDMKKRKLEAEVAVE